ncbi:MAG: phospholipid-binding lipoprotein MlaA [Gammaproteobacteria bacterium]|jgi:phospholipid-binding lipoprotein MlaA
MKKNVITALILVSSLFLSGCASLDGPTDPSDPFESYNRSMDTFNKNVDHYVLKPVAKGYDAITPSPVQKGVGNFFSNLDDVLVIFNDLFQFKFKQLASDTGRLLVNSTVGLFGLIDWASDMGLEKHNEDFGQTLGYWGISSGPYLILPFFGPSTVRDTGGLFTDSSYLDPINNEVHERWVYPNRNRDISISLTIVKAVDFRAGLLKAENVLNEAALDPYIYVREVFLQRRNNLVHDGNPPFKSESDIDDLFDEDDIFEN